MTYDARIEADPDHGWSLLEAALADDRLTDTDFRALVQMSVDVFGPGIPPDAKRAPANQRWLDVIVKSRSTRAGAAPPSDERLQRRMTADEIIKADAVRRGEVVVALPRDPKARAIVLAGMRAKNEL